MDDEESTPEQLLHYYLYRERRLEGWFPGPQQAECAMRRDEVKAEILRRMA